MANLLSGMFAGRWSDDPMKQEQMRTGALQAAAAGLDTHGKPPGRILSQMLGGFQSGQLGMRRMQGEESEQAAKVQYYDALGMSAMAKARTEAQKHALAAARLQARAIIENGGTPPADIYDRALGGNLFGGGGGNPMMGSGAAPPGAPGGMPPPPPPPPAPTGPQGAAPMGPQPAVPQGAAPQAGNPLFSGLAQRGQTLDKLTRWALVEPTDISAFNALAPQSVGGRTFDMATGGAVPNLPEGMTDRAGGGFENAPGYAQAVAGREALKTEQTEVARIAAQYMARGLTATTAHALAAAEAAGTLQGETGLPGATTQDSSRQRFAGEMEGRTGERGGNEQTRAQQELNPTLVTVVDSETGAESKMTHEDFTNYNRISAAIKRPPLTTNLGPGQRAWLQAGPNLVTRPATPTEPASVNTFNQLFPDPNAPQNQPGAAAGQPGAAAGQPGLQYGRSLEGDRDAARSQRQWEDTQANTTHAKREALAAGQTEITKLHDEATIATNANLAIDAAYRDFEISGRFTPAMATVGGWWSALGVAPEKVQRFVSRAERLDSMFQDRTLIVMMTQKGVISDKDALRIEIAAGRWSNTPDANRFIADLAKSGNLRKIRRAEMLQKAFEMVVDSNGTLSYGNAKLAVDAELRAHSSMNDPHDPLHKWRGEAQ